MLKNYLEIALRNFVRHRAYSFNNIVGLAIGMSCSILINAISFAPTASWRLFAPHFKR